MTMTVENKNIVSSSSSTSTELPLSFPPFDNPASMVFDFSDFNDRIRSIPSIRTRPSQEDNKSTSEDEKGCFFYLILIICVCEEMSYFASITWVEKNICWYLTELRGYVWSMNVVVLGSVNWSLDILLDRIDWSYVKSLI